jgi:ribosomal-protein-alanine N-acetyltransferase
MTKTSFLERTTPRLVVRTLREGDEAAWREAWTTMLPAKNRWDVGPRARAELSRAAFEELIDTEARWRETDSRYPLVVVRLDDGAIVGAIGIVDVVRSISQTAFLGYRIFNRHWGQGFAGEAVRAAIDIAFVDLGLHRVEAGIEPGNRRSIRLARSLGMRLEGRKKLAVHLRDQWVDLSVYALTCEDLGYRFSGHVGQRGPARDGPPAKPSRRAPRSSLP